MQRAVLANEYDALDAAVEELCAAVAADVAAGGTTLVHDTVNNALHLRRSSPPKPKAAAEKPAEKPAEENGEGADEPEG